MTDIALLVQQIASDIRTLDMPNTPAIREVRKKYSSVLKSAAPEEVLALAHALIDEGEGYRWVAYELIHFHKPTLYSLDRTALEALGAGIDTWDKVDTFAPWLSGVAWRRGQISDDVIHDWARSDDLWWRRAALVSTVALNNRARGGTGDVSRTLAVCDMLVDDREDMVVKAMSWALRQLVPYDPAAVRAFLEKHEDRLAARVIRETRNKLETGLKNP